MKNLKQKIINTNYKKRFIQLIIVGIICIAGTGIGGYLKFQDRIPVIQTQIEQHRKQEQKEDAYKHQHDAKTEATAVYNS